MAWRGTRAVVGMATGILMAGAVAAVPAHATTTSVTCTSSDTTNGTNLQAAVAAAVSGDTILLDDYCVYALTAAASGDDGLAPIGITLTIDTVSGGNTATIQRSTSAGSFRIFEVTSGGDLTLNNTTVMNGSVTGLSGGGVLVDSDGTLTGDNAVFQGNSTTIRGGGIRVESGGTLSLTDSRVNDNKTSHDGAGIDSQGTGTLIRTTVDGNRADSGGGGINTDSGAGTLTITDSVIKNNWASGFGAGIDLESTASITGTTIADNATSGNSEGAGIRVFQGALTMQDSAITGNLGSVRGAGLSMSGTATATITDTEITGNRAVHASAQGGGIWVNGSSLTLDGVTVSGNLASGRYAQGGGLFSTGSTSTLTIQNNSAINANKVTGTGSAAGGIYNSGASYTALTDSTVDDNIAPNAPAPGGIYTDTAITNTTGSTFTGNTPTNCLLSPAAVTGCVS